MKTKKPTWIFFLLSYLVFFVILFVSAKWNVDEPFQTYPGILIAMSAGFLGASFSMLIQNQQRVSDGSLEDLTAASSWHTLIVRGSVGLGAAVILYFFFESGLLEGSLWPDLKELGYSQIISSTAAEQGADTSDAVRETSIIVPNRNWCLLVIWCFLAGFSETLVPTILQKTEEKATQA